MEKIIRKLEEIHANYKKDDDFGFIVGIEKAIELIKNETQENVKVTCSACSGSGYYCGNGCGSCEGTGLED